jgi:hypothetical protein
MARKGQDLVDSSLDLLLDTITNAFGGILFLSILIVLLLRMTSQTTPEIEPTADPPSQAEIVRMQAELASAASQLAQLQATAELRAGLDSSLADDTIRELHAQNQQRKAQRDAALARRLNAAQQLAETQQRNNRTRDSLAALSTQLQQSEQELAHAQAELAKETEKRTRSASLPQARATQKAEVAMVVRYGRAYVLFRYDERGGFNTADFIVLGKTTDGRIQLTPKPYAGIPIDDTAGLQAALRSKLRSVPASQHYLAFSVWEDSFDEFAPLKKAAIDLGYEYRVLAIRDGEAVYSGFIGTPRVQ